MVRFVTIHSNLTLLWNRSLCSAHKTYTCVPSSSNYGFALELFNMRTSVYENNLISWNEHTKLNCSIKKIHRKRCNACNKVIKESIWILIHEQYRNGTFYWFKWNVLGRPIQRLRTDMTSKRAISCYEKFIAIPQSNNNSKDFIFMAI